MSGAVAVVEPVTPAPVAADSPPAAPDTSLLSNPAAEKPAAVPEDKAPATDKAEPSLLSGDPDKPGDKADGPADAKPADTPETYQSFTLPEGMAIDDGMLAKATPVFQKLGLKQEGAQELVSLYAEQVKAQTEAVQNAQVKAWTDMVTGWKNESRVDAEFGGAKLAENLGAAKAFMGRLDPKGAALKVFDEYGISNHPDVLRFLTRAAQTISEDKAISRGDGAPQQTPKKPWEVMYPHLAKKE